MSNIVKVCKVHGELTIEQTRKDGHLLRCKACRIEKNKKSYYKNREKRVACSIRWKGKNREEYNKWCREDRKKNPEKYRKYEKNYIEKRGIKKVRRQEVLRLHGISEQQHDEMITMQNNKCAICGREEIRKGRSGEPKPLCIDHCHTTNKIRGLLCGSCNTGLGSFRDSPEILLAAIEYVKKFAV